MLRLIQFLLLVPVLGCAAVAPGAVRASEAYGALPLAFEANQGQAERHAKFLTRGGGCSMLFTSQALVLGCASASAPEGAVLRMKLAGARTERRIVPLERLTGKVNYFLGNDPKKWRTGIPTYHKVKYEGVYPGIDLVYYGNGKQLEYDLVVSPGADPRRIELSFEGIRRLTMDANGDLLLRMPGGEMRQHRPRIYQEIDGARREIAGGYILKAGNRAGLRLGPYDASRPLVIDPVLSYSTFLGGSDSETGNGIAVDSAGSVYITGSTTSSDFPVTGRSYQAKSGNRDVFVTKLKPSGKELVYSSYFGGAGLDIGRGIAVDRDGNAYVMGDTTSVDFPTVNAPRPNYGGGEADAFVIKLNADGSAPVYSTFLGGSDEEYGNGIAVTASGETCVVGFTRSMDFPTAHALQPSFGGGSTDAFVARLNPAGTQLVYSTYLGGGGDDFGMAVAVDASGNAYVTGATNSTNFRTATAYQGANQGGFDVFLTKLNPSGSALAYSTYLGGDLDDFGRAIAVDAGGNAYVTGDTASHTFPARNAFQANRAGGNIDAFVTKLNPQGAALIYSTYLGGGGVEGLGDDRGAGIAVDSSGSAYVTGFTRSDTFPVVSPLQPPGGVHDAFIAKLSPAGSELVYSTYLGGSDIDGGYGIAVDAGGNAYVTGYTDSRDFPVLNALQPEFGAGSQHAFIARISGGPSIASVSAASYAVRGALAPDSIASGFGSGLVATTVVAKSLPLPTTLGGVSVKVKDSAGTERLAPLFFVSPGQINYLVPAGTSTGIAAVTVVKGDTAIAAGSSQVAAVAPGLFSANANGQGVAAAVAIHVAADNSQTSQLIFQCGAAAGSCVSTPIDLGPEQEKVILLLYGTGIRGRSALSAVSVKIGGESAEVLYAGPQVEFAGLDQLNVAAPRSLIGRGEVDILVTVDGITANPVRVNIK